MSKRLDAVNEECGGLLYFCDYDSQSIEAINVLLGSACVRVCIILWKDYKLLKTPVVLNVKLTGLPNFRNVQPL